MPNLRAADGCTDGTREGRPRGEQRAVFSTLQRLKRKGTVTLTIVYGAAAARNSERQEPQDLLSAHGQGETSIHSGTSASAQSTRAVPGDILASASASAFCFCFLPLLLLLVPARRPSVQPGLVFLSLARRPSVSVESSLPPVTCQRSCRCTGRTRSNHSASHNSSFTHSPNGAARCDCDCDRDCDRDHACARRRTDACPLVAQEQPV